MEERKKKGHNFVNDLPRSIDATVKKLSSLFSSAVAIKWKTHS